MSPTRLCDEMDHLIKNYGARNIFDDTGALPTGNWLIRLCDEMIARKMLDHQVELANEEVGRIESKAVALQEECVSLENEREYQMDRWRRGKKRYRGGSLYLGE